MQVNEQAPARPVSKVPTSGWVTYSAIILILAGIMRIFDGIWAFRYKGTVVDDLSQAVYGNSLTTYGWIWVIVGAVLIVAGLLLVVPWTSLNRQIPRWIGIIAAAVAAFTAVAWLPYYPEWAVVYIALSTLVLYGLSARFDGYTD